ncbi:hypothetical protein [Hymenobacter volaticus]|uniref:Outer membrane protein beta-barrel domain-containing protein n=1 Tax=Hymenobacter volaticus TaxID=2932254 RepID=A0ABY4GAA3_9BACT|nr:hypothetical protein [Hymenobacter volaticus]UOQ67374.1 hypothetical protein MUN86_05700 [Hymenobacter volaticus]
MLRLSIFLVSVLLAGSAAAQTTPMANAGVATSSPTLPGVLGPRQSFRVNAGFMTAGRYGSASYVSPEMGYKLSNRLTVFTGLTYMRLNPGLTTYAAGDGAPRAWSGTNQYLIQAGAQYAVSPRLALTGTAWKDLSNSVPRGMVVNPYAGFGGNMGSGMSLRADYMINENITISGGIRTSNGQSSMYPGYSPGLTGGGIW